MKIAVIHPGKQHSFQLATGLEKQGILWKYITSVYDRPFTFTRLLLKVVRGDLKKKISTRKSDNIPNRKVLQFNELGVIITLFFNRIPLIHKFAENWNFFIESSFYKKVMKRMKKELPDAIIYYNGYANKHLDILDGLPIVKIMDVSIGHRLTLQKILDKEVQSSGLLQIREEHFSYWDNQMIANDIKGCKDTDYFLAASQFVKNSLIENGIQESQIKLVPYGVNTQQFSPKQTKHIENGSPLKLLYVGSINYRKGIHRLLHALKGLKNVEISLAGGYSSTSPIYQMYKAESNIHFLGFVTRDRLNDIYNESHVFVLPSFCEGMAMVGLEAMSAGLPIICSSNTGVNDVVKSGVNGFVYAPDDEDALRNHIEWFLKNKDQLPIMSENARNTSLGFSWEIYHANVAKAIQECIKESGK